eukprot:TRINITY_DN24193_c0_g1_i1.p1 TRINITY_DN24193_c0_g1~~TRINITY_DN24193_c0_g1_i1.p1  ORF type:complete len:727 (-),score=101.82 TRINITY_DN24193_c0_g1_i1:73-2019(-)
MMTSLDFVWRHRKMLTWFGVTLCCRKVAGEPDCKMHLRWRNYLVHGELPHRDLQDRRRADRTEPELPVHAAASFAQSRVIAAPAGDWIVVAWQESNAIWLQRFGHTCNRVGHTMLVVKFLGFSDTFRSSEYSNEVGLADVLASFDGGIVVLYILHGHVWAKFVDREGALGVQVRISDGDARPRKEASIASNPISKGGFVAAWSSLGQDGDGWGIFARFVDGNGTFRGPEHQVNQQSDGSQRRPRLVACSSGLHGPSVWAMWVKATLQDGQMCGLAEDEVAKRGRKTKNRANSQKPPAASKLGGYREEVFGGPFLRRLGSDSFDPGPELRLGEASSVSTTSIDAMALNCATSSATENPTAVWSMRQACSDVHSARLAWVVVDEAPRGGSNSKMATPRLSEPMLPQLAPALPDFLATPTRMPPLRFVPIPSASESVASSNNASLSKQNASGLNGSDALAGDVGTSGNIAPQLEISSVAPQLAIAAEGDVVASLASDIHGALTVQLMDMEPFVAYPTHELEYLGTTIDYVGFDVTEDQALIVCASSTASVICDRRRLHLFVRQQTNEATWWAIFIAATVFLWFCSKSKFRSGKGNSEPADVMGARIMARSAMQRGLLKAQMTQFCQDIRNSGSAAGLGAVWRWRQLTEKRF